MRPPLLALALLLLALLAWWPSLKSLGQPSADQVWEAYGLATACLPSPSSLGWMGPVPDVPGMGSLFAPGLFGPLLPGLACRLAQLSGLQPLQTYLLAGLTLTALLAFLSSRWAGLRGDTSLLLVFLMVTAPCSFSRLGHLSLAVLIPVVPALVACLQLRRSLWQPGRPLALIGAGALAALLTFPSQDYYVAFSLLLLFASFALLLLISSAASLELAPLASQARRGGLFLAGFVVVLLVVFLPKLMAAGLISIGGAGAGAGGGVPASWATPRLADEQFRYGLLPFTWVIPSPWLAATLDALRAGWVNTGSESYARSVGSLLIPIGWIAAIRRLAQRRWAVDSQPSHQGQALGDADRRFLALLLLLATALGLLVMTMGGLGTLFAAFVSPLLRSLNRFTAFVYGAAVLYLVAELDLWLQRRDQTA